MKITEKLGRFVRTLTGRTNARTDREVPYETTAETGVRTQTSTARAPRRTADIPFDRIEETYSPTQTSLKAGFRVSGDEFQKNQEFADGVADDRWNDEDRLTNKSGDPRIGTHGRTYEPGESRATKS